MYKGNLPLEFYKETLDTLQAGVYINQLDDVNDFSTASKIYINPRCIAMAGYTLEEFEQMKKGFFASFLHPEDFRVVVDSVSFLLENPSEKVTGVGRIMHKDGHINWVYSTSAVYKMRQGIPWQFINVMFDIQEPLCNDVKLYKLIHENALLNNKLRISNITKREKEIIKEIVLGRTDKEISEALNISPNTAKTHRKNILRKLSINNTAELVRFAMEAGIY